MNTTSTSSSSATRGPIASFDDPEADPIWSSDEEDVPNQVITTENHGILHVHEENQCIHCVVFLLSGGNGCINPECPSTLQHGEVWVDT